MTITGRTTVYSILAHPVRHVRTPERLNALFAQEGHDGVLVACDVRPEDLGQAVAQVRASLNWGGCVVTVPHKTAMVAHCDRLSPEAAAAGAVNVVRREPDGTLTGDLLDGRGFLAGLLADGIAPRGQRVWLAGAGGAGSAIAFALAREGVAHLTVSNRSPEKLAGLVERLRADFPGLSVQAGGPVAGHAIVINATSLGLRPDDPLPVDPEDIDPSMVVAEVVMEPEITKLLSAARARGARIHPGARMLDGQIAGIFAFLTEGRP